MGHYSWIIIVAVVALVAFVMYRRGRRLIGHQRFHERRIVTRAIVLVALSVYLAVMYARRGDPMLAYASAACGFAVGLVIALISLRFTRMGVDERGVWYVPNLFLGIGLIAVLVGRFVYEYFVLFPQIKKQMAAAGAQGASAAHAVALGPQPVLHGILFLVLGYYVIYYAGVLVRARREGHLEASRHSSDNTLR
jgi:O-antigen/teichoic acid export membrane protein